MLLAFSMYLMVHLILFSKKDIFIGTEIRDNIMFLLVTMLQVILKKRQYCIIINLRIFLNVLIQLQLMFVFVLKRQVFFNHYVKKTIKNKEIIYTKIYVNCMVLYFIYISIVITHKTFCSQLVIICDGYCLQSYDKVFQNSVSVQNSDSILLVVSSVLLK